MPLIFQIEQKPKYKSKTVFGVEIPVYGELTVDEAIAMDKAIAEYVSDSRLTTEYQIARLAGWLSCRLDSDIKHLIKFIRSSKPLLDALWLVYYDEDQSITFDYELEEVKEVGNEDTVPSLISTQNGTRYILNSQAVNLKKNSLVILDDSISA